MPSCADTPVLQVCLWQHYSAKGIKCFSKLIKATFYDKVTSSCCAFAALPCSLALQPCLAILCPALSYLTPPLQFPFLAGVYPTPAAGADPAALAKLFGMTQGQSSADYFDQIDNLSCCYSAMFEVDS